MPNLNFANLLTFRDRFAQEFTSKRLIEYYYTNYRAWNQGLVRHFWDVRLARTKLQGKITIF
jgi:hypothetical protein